MDRARTQVIRGETVLDNEAGRVFYHKHLSKRAKAKKKADRKRARKSRKRQRKGNK